MLFLEEEYFGYCNREVLRAVPVEDLYRGTTEEEVVGDDDLRAEEVKEGVDAEVHYCNGVMVKGVAPLEIMIATGEERRVGNPLINSGEGPVIGPMNKMIARAIDL